jgi:uncharacterized protein
VVTTAVHGGIFMPRFHGRIQVDLLGERVGGVLQPPRYRPLPNSPVFQVGEDETADILNVGGDIRLGLAVGHDEVVVGVPSDSKGILPRHTGIIGTTGGGKSTTVAGFVSQAQVAGLAVILLDVEGEYTRLNEPTTDPQMRSLLARRGLSPEGVKQTSVYHLVGREAANPDHPRLAPFSLRFSDLSPYTVSEILDLSDAQMERYLLAYDTAKAALRRFGVIQADDLQLDELESGCPGLRLDHLIDVASAFEAALTGGTPTFRSREFRDPTRADELTKTVQADKKKTSFPVSWRVLLGRLGRLHRLAVFDNPQAKPIDFERLLDPGSVSIVDLSDTDSPDLTNLAISAILRGVQRAQETAYEAAARVGQPLPGTLVVIEEAHEFLSKERIARMPHLFAQVARIAKRGRKRWLSLIFVTQLPQHLPRQVLGLVNNFVLHKINDVVTINRLKGSIAGIDEALWTRLPGLAPGQAIVSFASMARPLLVAIDPAPARLRMID